MRVPRNLELGILRRLVGRVPQTAKPPPSRDELVALGAAHVKSCLPEDPARLRGMRVLDFGCGAGWSSYWLASQGVDVVGCDLQSELFADAQQRGEAEGLALRFVDHSSKLPSGSFDALLSHDSFEHLADPAGILAEWHRVLAVGGRAYLKFGPLWGSPLGLHMFGSISYRRLPWLHLLFREETVMQLWSEMAGVSPPLTRYDQRAGGMNKMTVARFRQFVESSPLELASMTVIPVQTIWRIPVGAASEVLHRVPVAGELFSAAIEAVLERRV